MNKVIPIYGDRAELNANKIEKRIEIRVFSFNGNKDFKTSFQETNLGSQTDYFMVWELKNHFSSEKWDKECFVGKILDYHREFKRFDFDIDLVRAELDKLARVLFFKSHGARFREIREWSIELWDFKAVLLKVEEEKTLEDIKNLGIGYLALWK